MLERVNLIVILGPTACGKTRLAANIAYLLKSDVISADSRQVYRGMDIGTGKDYEDYVVNGNRITYHLIDILSPDEEFNVFLFRERFIDIFLKLQSENKLPVLAGGTGMYLSSVIQNYQLPPALYNTKKIEQLSELSEEDIRNRLLSSKVQLHNTTDLTDKKRMINALIIAESETQPTPMPSIFPLIIGIFPGRETVKQNISRRLHERLNNGLIEEVQNLISEGISHEKLEFFGLEYRYISRMLRNQITRTEMLLGLEQAIANFAKRQMTWFRRMEKQGVKINWLKDANIEKALQILRDNNVRI